MHLSERRSGYRVWLGVLWAFPVTAVGLLLAYAVVWSRGQIEWTSEAVVARGPLANWLLSHHPFGSMYAMVIGHVVIARDEPLPGYIWRHEMEHVRQGARWGIFFPLAYCLASVFAVLRGRHIYMDNIFEIAARRAEHR